MARQLARRRQRERVVGAAVAVLGIVVLVVAIWALRDPNTKVDSAAVATTTAPGSTASSTHPATSASSSPTPSPTHRHTPSPTASSSPAGTDSSRVKAVPLLVLNDTDISQLAATAAQRFKAAGWSATADNLPSNITDIISTCAYYDPANTSARAAAQALQHEFPTIKRVVPRFADLPAAPVVVVLTPDYSPA